MKRRKIYYVPGMISLIFLPVLCVWYLNEHKNVERCIDIVFPQRYSPINDHRFDTTSLSLPENKRKYINYKLTGNIANDRATLDSFNLKLLNIFKNKDTKTGLHINIKDSAKYISMIEIIDICKKDSFWPAYFFYDNEFWYFHREWNDSIKKVIKDRLKNSESNSYSDFLVSDVVYIKPELPFWENNSLLSNSLKLWPFFIIYILFSIISILYIKNKQLNNMNALINTDFHFDGQTNVYHGKVRDVYTVKNDLLVMVATDRISAFDVVLPKGIPYKGQMLNQIAAKFLDATADIVPNWKLASPDPMVTVGLRCEGYPVEMIVRGYLCGSAWRTYKSGVREICGVKIPDGMRENQRFPQPIITPTTKAELGRHDEDITREEILSQGLVSKDEYEMLEKYTMALFFRGTEMAAARGLILVDTKYEFGRRDGKIYLIDEIHTPDSSRYFYADSYQQLFEKGEAQKQLSKEFVREWLMENGFQGKDGQQVPEMTPEIVAGISERYIELFENISGEAFDKADIADIKTRIKNNVVDYLKTV